MPPWSRGEEIEVPSVENIHFKNVIDYLRDRRDDEVSLTDVVALAEIERNPTRLAPVAPIIG